MIYCMIVLFIYIIGCTIYICLKVLKSLDYLIVDIVFANEEFYFGNTGRAVNMRVGLVLRNT